MFTNLPIQKLIERLKTATELDMPLSACTLLVKTPLTQQAIEQLEIGDVIIILRFLAKYAPQILACSAVELLELKSELERIIKEVKLASIALEHAPEGKKWQSIYPSLVKTALTTQSPIINERELYILYFLAILTTIILIGVFAIMTGSNNISFIATASMLILCIICILWYMTHFYIKPAINKKATAINRLYEFQNFLAKSKSDPILDRQLHDTNLQRLYGGTLYPELYKKWLTQLIAREKAVKKPRWIQTTTRKLLADTKMFLSQNLSSINSSHTLHQKRIDLIQDPENDQAYVCIVCRVTELTGEIKFFYCPEYKCPIGICDNCSTRVIDYGCPYHPSIKLTHFLPTFSRLNPDTHSTFPLLNQLAEMLEMLNNKIS